MAIYTFPDVYPHEDSLTPFGATDKFDSRAGTTQTSVKAGARWNYRVSFRNLKPRQYAQLQAFIARLNGQEHRARIQVFSHHNLGLARTSGQVAGAGQKGTSLVTDNWSGVTAGNLFEIGDLIEVQYANRSGVSTDPIESRLHMVTQDASAGTSATLTIWPPITVAPADNAIVNPMEPKETWILGDAPTFGKSSATTNNVTITFTSDLLAGLQI